MTTIFCSRVKKASRVKKKQSSDLNFAIPKMMWTHFWCQGFLFSSNSIVLHDGIRAVAVIWSPTMSSLQLKWVTMPNEHKIDSI